MAEKSDFALDHLFPPRLWDVKEATKLRNPMETAGIDVALSRNY